MMDDNSRLNYIKKDLGTGPIDILNHFLNMDDNLCPTQDGTYVGKVVDNNDPEKLGRCRIVVYGVFDGDIPDNQLPWAIPEFGFVGSLKGSFIVPQIGAFVKVTFENDEINLPKYSTKVLNVNQLPSNKDKNYPNNMVFFETDAGDSFEVDRSNSEVIFTHNTGTKITINPDGTMDIHSSRDINITHDKNLFVDGSFVEPEAVGPLCALPTCLFTGAAHTGRTCYPPGGKPIPETAEDTTEEE